MEILILHFLNSNLKQDCNSSSLEIQTCSQSLTLQPVFGLFLKFTVLFSDASILCNIVPKILRTHSLSCPWYVFSQTGETFRVFFPINTFFKVKYSGMNQLSTEMFEGSVVCWLNIDLRSIYTCCSSIFFRDNSLRYFKCPDIFVYTD